MKKITVYGREYPCRLTMGALRRYKIATGHEVSELSGTAPSALCTLIYCAVQSACRADGVEFALSEEEFADGVDMDAMTEFGGFDGRTDEAKKAADGKDFGIERLTGLAVGAMGLSLTDFDCLTPAEFGQVHGAYLQLHVREPWERARFLACCMLQPYSKKALKARDVCSFSWDDEGKSESEGRQPAAESTDERWREMMKRCG